MNSARVSRAEVARSRHKQFRIAEFLAVLLCISLPTLAFGDTPFENETQKLLASDGAADDVFGAQSLALDGDVLAVGALLDDDGIENSGSVYVYERDAAGTWAESAKLTASDGAVPESPTGAFDTFGFAVDVDGDTIVVGAVNGEGSAEDSGAAYIFERDGSGAWTETVKLSAIDGVSGDNFGRYVALENDTLVISASRDDDDGEDSGSVYIFTRNGAGIWSEQQKLTASDAETDELFGFSLGLDDDSLIVGALANDGGEFRTGAAYVFTRDINGAWNEQQKLTASDAETLDNFGWRVAIDADTAVVNSIWDDDLADRSGAVYVFTRDAGGVWSEVDKLLASDGGERDSFGFSLDIEGNILVAGATGKDDNGDGSGAVYVFKRDVAGFWHERRKLLPLDGAAGDNFGDGLALEAGTAIVGSAGDDDNGNDSGSAYVFEIDLVGMDINFDAPLHTIFTDMGSGIYSGVPIGTDFFGAINDATFSGFISDGTTRVDFDCCIAAGGLSVENDVEVFDAENAEFLNSIAGTGFVSGDVYDSIDIEGDVGTPSGGRIEVGLSYVLDSSAFDDDNTNHYPADPDDILVAVYFIAEFDDLDDEIYSAIGVISGDDEDAAGESLAFSYLFVGTDGNPWSAGATLSGRINGVIDGTNPDLVEIRSFDSVVLSRPGLPPFVYDEISRDEFNVLRGAGRPSMSFTGLLNNIRSCPEGFEPDFPGDCSFSSSPGGGFLLAPSSSGTLFATAADGSGNTPMCNGAPNQQGCRVTDFPFVPANWQLLRLDPDEDGIETPIDGFFAGAFTDQSEVFSNDFTDQHRGGTTHGSIVVRGDNPVTVADDDIEGVVLSSSGSGFSLVQMCGPANIDIFNVVLVDTKVVAVTCGSLTAEVLTGPVSITVGVNINIVLPEGAKAFMEQLPGSLVSITNLSGPGGPDIVVEDDNGATPVGPGDPPLVTVVDDGMLDAPDDVAGRAKRGKVNLVWTPVDEAEVYDVFRGSQSGGPYDLVGSVTGSVFVDTDVLTGETYFYVVQSVANGSRSENSNEAEVLVPARRRR